MADGNSASYWGCEFVKRNAFEEDCLGVDAKYLRNDCRIKSK